MLIPTHRFLLFTVVGGGWRIRDYQRGSKEPLLLGRTNHPVAVDVIERQCGFFAAAPVHPVDDVQFWLEYLENPD